MAAALTVASHMKANCPLCGVRILSVGRGGRLSLHDIHPIALGRRARAGDEGYMLCDDCGLLAELPANLALN